MSWLRGVELLAGVYYFVFGVDGFLKKIPLPPPSERGLKFLMAVEESGYIMPMVKILEIVVGLSWMLGLGSGLAWLIFTPILFNILAYHFFLNKKELVLPIGLLLMHGLLALKNSEYLLTVVHGALAH